MFFISVSKTIECILVAVAFAVMSCFIVYKQTGVLQASGYSNKKYYKWLGKKGNLAYQRHLMLALMSALACLVLSFCFSFLGEWSAVAGLAPYLLFFIIYIIADKKIALRSEVKFTPRLKRLYAVIVLINAIVAYLLVCLLNFADFVCGNAVFTVIRYFPLAVLILLAIPLMTLSNCIAKIYEVPHNKKFIKKAKEKLAQSDIKVIGITGSYGKTSTKFILNKILSEKYRVLATPSSHNTPIGIALSVNNANLSDYDFFIAEMGARHLGDIAELCGVCPPDISVITGVCGQHLETFSSFRNIIKAKGEILESTKTCAVIADDCFDLFADYDCPVKRCDCVSDVKATCEGTEFTLTLGGESRKVKTKLLGAHSAYNIGISAQVAFEAGMDIDEIVSACSELDYIEHRLQLIKNGGVNILDDGYNSNVKGAREALKVLASFGGKKIVVTPGLVELGVLEEKENFELGKELTGFDRIILVGETLVQPVRQGYIQAGGDPEKLSVVPTLGSTQELLKGNLSEGDTVLFLNDLPDIY